MIVDVRICLECAAKLRAILAQQGEETMAAAVGPTLQACPVCKDRLPPGKCITRLKPFDGRPS